MENNTGEKENNKKSKTDADNTSTANNKSGNSTNTKIPSSSSSQELNKNNKANEQNISTATNIENDEASKLREIINKLRDERNSLIRQIKANKYKLYYKETEKTAVTKLIDENKDNIDYKKIRYLKKLKNRIEFKISTSSSSLNEEKELIRKINQVNEELSKSMKFVRMKRKLELINGDIEQYKANISDLNNKISAIDLKLDDYFSKLRAINRRGNKFERFGDKKDNNNNKNYHDQNKKYEPRPAADFSIEDIAVIKKPKKQ